MFCLSFSNRQGCVSAADTIDVVNLRAFELEFAPSVVRFLPEVVSKNLFNFSSGYKIFTQPTYSPYIVNNVFFFFNIIIYNYKAHMSRLCTNNVQHVTCMTRQPSNNLYLFWERITIYKISLLLFHGTHAENRISLGWICRGTCSAVWTFPYIYIQHFDDK